MTKSILLLVAGMVMVSSAKADQKIYLQNAVVNPSAMNAWDSTEVRLQNDFFEEVMVLFKGNIRSEDRNAIESAGAQVLSYLPENAFLVRGTVSQISKVENLSSVEKVMPFTANYKISREFGQISI